MARWTVALAACALVVGPGCRERVVVGRELPSPALSDTAEEPRDVLGDAGTAVEESESNDDTEDPTDADLADEASGEEINE